MSRFPACLLLSAVLLFGAAGLAAGQAVPIPTFTPENYTDILSGDYKNSPARISGQLTLPSGGARPVPAVVVMHGSGGIRPDTELAVANALVDAGIATLIVDSFRGRGLSDTGKDQGQLPMAATVLDAFQALLALRARSEIDGARIGVVGFSRGGVAAMFTNQRPLKEAVVGATPGFAAHSPVYPGCSTQWDEVSPTPAPLLFLLGARDDLTPARKCEDYAGRIRSAGGKAEAIVYPGVSHQFLIPKQRGVRDAANFADCDLRIRASGEMYSPALGLAVGNDWKGFVRKVFKDCGKKGFRQGGTAESQRAAVADIVAFFQGAIGPGS